MKRYQGESLPDRPRIAVVANDAIGNFVVGTPLMQMLREKFSPCTLDYYGGTRTWELVEASDLIDFAHPAHGAQPNQTAKVIAEQTGDRDYDLVVNMEWTGFAKSVTGMLCGLGTAVCGPCIGNGGRGDLAWPSDDRGALWADQEWLSEKVTSRYPFLKSGFIGEIFCRLAYLDGDVPNYRLPVADPKVSVPDVLIATAASLPEKLWAHEKWISLLSKLKASGLTIGLIGAPKAKQAEFWNIADTEDDLVNAGIVQDFRGAFTLPQVVGALGQARMVLSIDNGIMHLAAGTDTAIVGLFRHGIHRLWCPPRDGITVMTPGDDSLVAAIEEAEVELAVRKILG